MLAFSLESLVFRNRSQWEIPSMNDRSLRRILTILVSALLTLGGGYAAANQSTEPVAESRSALLRRVADATRVTASGTWSTKDSDESGTWKIDQAMRIDDSGEFSGEILITRYSDGLTRPAKFVANVGNGAVNVSVSPPTYQWGPAFWGNLSATPYGALLEGRFENEGGDSGQWTGFWHAWAAVPSH